MNYYPSHLFVFDIETIPDHNAASNLTGCESLNIDEQREALTNYHLEVTAGKNDFLRQPFHKVVAISYALFSIDFQNNSEDYTLKYIRSGGSNEQCDEKELIQGFFSVIEKYMPRIVTFNGRTFDIPVLKYRAMKYGISCKAFYEKTSGADYQYRYAVNYNLDLLDVLSDFGSSARIKLHEVCSILGFPGKFGVEGSKVTSMFDAGNLKDIRDYCETDVVNTYLVYLRYSLHIGRITKNIYNNSIQNLIDFISNSNESHLNDFKTAWIKSSNNNLFL